MYLRFSDVPTALQEHALTVVKARNAIVDAVAESYGEIPELGLSLSSLVGDQDALNDYIEFYADAMTDWIISLAARE